MKVMIDVTVLGSGRKYNLSRTGIHRVIAELVARLLEFDEITYVFSSIPDESMSVMEYFSENYVLNNGKLANYPAKLVSIPGSGLYQNLASLRAVLRTKKRVHLVKRLGRRVVRHLFRAMTAARHYSGVVATDRLLNECDIYHETYYNVDWIEPKNEKIRFQTLYDLIPIHFPQYFDSNAASHPVRKVIDGLNQDDYVLCISDNTRQDLLNYTRHLDPAKCIVTPLAAGNRFYPCIEESDIFRIRTKYKIPAEDRYILSLCTLEPRKNLISLVRSYGNLLKSEKVKDLSLVLTGSIGWKSNDLLAEIGSDKDLKGKVILTGFVPDEDLSPLYSGALSFVYPSLYEGFGLPPLEAMQCGTPVITSNTSSLPEVVGDAGIMVDPLDLDAISQAMLSMYKSDDLRRRYAEKSLPRSRLFSWERCARQTVEAYRAAMAGGK